MESIRYMLNLEWIQVSVRQYLSHHTLPQGPDKKNKFFFKNVQQELSLFCLLYILPFYVCADTHSSVVSFPSKPSSSIWSQKSKVAKSDTRILVKYKDSATDRVIQSNQYKSVKSFKTFRNLQIIDVKDKDQFSAVLMQLNNDPRVEYAEPDYQLSLFNIPNDEYYFRQWALSDNNGEAGASINAPIGWDHTTGDKSVVVAVLDTGVDVTHEDLIDNIWVNPNEIPNNNIDDDNNGYVDDVNGIDTTSQGNNPMDTYGHGTHVSGIISAKGNNEVGIAGVSWSTKIIACKIFSDQIYGLKAFVSSAVECLDYIYDLKVNHGVNIVASNNSWGWVGPSSKALQDAIQRQQDAGILFVAAAGNWGSNNSSLPTNPANYNFSNVISVAASNRWGDLTYFSNYGQNSVHLAAPGDEIVSTVIGRDFDRVFTSNPFNNFYFHDAESDVESWTAEGSWQTTESLSFSGAKSWTDSESAPYEDNTDSSLISPPIDLISVTEDVYLSFFSNYELEGYFDYLYIEASADGENWSTLGSLSGRNYSWELKYFFIPKELYSKQFQFRFRLVSDFIISYDGVYIDEIGIGTRPDDLDLSSNRYEEYSGTSMAAPHVVGMLSLLKAQDLSRDWKQLKNLVISSGVPMDEHADKTISGRLLRAADIDSYGSLTCSDQIVSAILSPKGKKNYLVSGSQIAVEYLNINCDHPGGEVHLGIKDSEISIPLYDKGENGDSTEGDGVYSALLDDRYGSSYDLEIEDSVINIDFITPYSSAFIERQAYQSIRDGSAVEFAHGEGVLATMPLPFNTKFSNDKYFDNIAISENGYVILYNNDEGDAEENSFYFPIDQHPSYPPVSLPFGSYQNVIAPFWDELHAINGGVYWKVLGQAPNRTLVIEWYKMTHFVEGGEYSFQLHLHESKSDIEFVFQNPNNFISAVSNKGSALSGIQVTPGHANVFNLSNLTYGNTVKWNIDSQRYTKASGLKKSSSDGFFAGLSPVILPFIFILASIRLRYRRM